MRLYFLLLIISVTYCRSALADEFTSERCSLAVAKADGAKGRIADAVVMTFFSSLVSKVCRSSAEYSEWSNETLFNLMGRFPQEFFRILQSSSVEVKEKVLAELSTPIHDLINYPKIKEAISTRISDLELKKYAFSVFMPIYEKHLREVRKWEEINHQKWKYAE